jgi:hypothetical protein
MLYSSATWLSCCQYPLPSAPSSQKGWLMVNGGVCIYLMIEEDEWTVKGRNAFLYREDMDIIELISNSS